MNVPLKPGDRVRVNTPNEPTLHGRIARVVERAPCEGVWRCEMLDHRDWPKNTYDWGFRYDEIELIRDRKRRPPLREELLGFTSWLAEQGLSLHGPDQTALFFFGQRPAKLVDRKLDDFVDDYLREHG